MEISFLNYSNQLNGHAWNSANCFVIAVSMHSYTRADDIKSIDIDFIVASAFSIFSDPFYVHPNKPLVYFLFNAEWRY